MLSLNRPAFQPEKTRMEFEARDVGTDRSFDIYNINVINNVINNPISNEKRKRDYREHNESLIRAQPEIR